MKESTVIATLEKQNKHILTLLKQSNFLNTRGLAIEQTLVASSPLRRLNYLLRPKSFWDEVDIRQREIVNEQTDD